MDRAERVLDEEVAASCEAACELGVVLRLTGVEASVLEKLDPRVREQLPQALTHGIDREGRVGSLRPAQVRAHRERGGVVVEQVLERR